MAKPKPTRPALKRVIIFRGLLRECFGENNQLESLELAMVRAYVATAEEEAPFTDAEIDACIKELADAEVLMREEDIIYLLKSGR